MTRDLAFAIFRRRIESATPADYDPFNSPLAWIEFDRPLSPSELKYAQKAFEAAHGIREIDEQDQR